MPHGAYGLRISGLKGASRWLVPQAADAWTLTATSTRGAVDTAPHELDDAEADLGLLGGGRLRLNREEMVARFTFPSAVPDADLLHPYLTAACALVWQWAGRETFHAGAFARGDEAVLVLGEKAAGKSSTLAHVAAEYGAAVLADDLAVIDERRVLVGPRCIDLRASAVGAAETSDVVTVRERSRARLDLPAAPGPLPVVATVVLRWGETASLDRVAPTERLRVLAAQRSYPPLGGDQRTLLWLASLPMLVLTRARDIAALPAAAAELLAGLHTGKRMVECRP